MRDSVSSEYPNIKVVTLEVKQRSTLITAGTGVNVLSSLMNYLQNEFENK